MKLKSIFLQVLFIVVLLIQTTTHAAYEDFDTDWTEVDTDGDITLTDNVITLDATDPSGRVYKRIEGQGLNGLRWRVKTKCVENAFGRRVAIFGMSQDADEDWTDWDDGFVVAWNGESLQLINIDTSTDDFCGLDLNTYYYLEIRRVENQLRCLIYSDEYSTLVDTLSLNDFSKFLYASDITLMSPEQITYSATNSNSESWDSVFGWTPFTTGTTVIEQTTFDNEETVHLSATGNNTASNYGGYEKDYGSTPNRYIVHWRDYYESLTVDGTRPQLYVYGATKSFIAEIYSGGIYIAGHGTLSCTIAEDTWYEWKAIVDQTEKTAIVCRKEGTGSWEYIGKATDLSNSGTSGRIKTQINGHSRTGTCEYYHDYFNIYENCENLVSEITVENAYSYRQTIQGFSNPGISYTADYSDNFDDNDITDWTTGVRDSGTTTAANGEMTNTGDAYAYIGFTQKANNACVLTYNATINSVGSGCAAYLLGLDGDGNVPIPTILESSGNYIWALYFNGAIISSDVRVTLDQEYTIQVYQDFRNSSGDYVTMIVDGVGVISTPTTADLEPQGVCVGPYLAGLEAIKESSATFTIDNIHFINFAFYYPNATVADNDDIIVLATKAASHSGASGNKFEIFLSTDDGDSWTHHQELDFYTDTGTALYYPGNCSIFYHSAGVYAFVNGMASGAEDRRTYVYKATYSGDTLSQFSIVEDGSSNPIYADKVTLFAQFVDPDDSDEIVLSSYSWKYSADASIGAFILNYDTATDTLDSSGDWVKVFAQGDYTGKNPNEFALCINPEDSDETIAIVRWDSYTLGTADKIISYATCSGDIHTLVNWSSDTSISSDWGEGHGGITAISEVGGQLFLGGYAFSGTANSNRYNAILQFEYDAPEELVNGLIFNNTVNKTALECGNGKLLSPKNGGIYHRYIGASGTTAFYEINMGVEASLNVTISGDDGIGQWRFTGESTWLDEGTRDEITAGSYTVEYKDVDGYITPTDANVVLSNGDYQEVTGTYTKLTSTQVIITIIY